MIEEKRTSAQIERDRHKYILDRLKNKSFGVLPEQYKSIEEEAIKFHTEQLKYWEEKCTNTNHSESTATA